MRLLSLVLGLAIVGVLLVFGVVVLGVLVIGGGVLLAWRQWKLSRSATTPVASVSRDPNVLEGEFVVLNHGRHVHH
jgi:threonine/homoserine/homoserine lactone efflux protein